MTKTIGKRGVVLCALIFMFALATPRAQTLTGTESRVTTAAADQFDPALSGNLVVYTDFTGVDADIWYSDLSSGVAFPVSTAPGDQQLNGISGTRIVFTDWNTMDVLVFDVTTGTTANLTNAAGSNSLDPAISGNFVVWTDDRHGNAEIYARDLVTGEERRITDSPLVDQAPEVRNGIVVWERCTGFACDVFAYEWATGAIRQLTTTPWAAEHSSDVSGRLVVFQREQGTPIDKDVVAFDLDSGTETVLELPGDQENPHISGDFVVFNDSASGVPHPGLWQLSTGQHFQVIGGPSGQYLNDIDGNRIVYSDTRNGHLDIYAYEFHVDGEPADTQSPMIHGVVDLTVDATSPLGASVPFNVYATDDTDPAPALSCTPDSGALFAIGTTQVTCTATDATGNSATATCSVTVRGAEAQLGALADLVAALNLRRGLENSLDAKLDAALAALDAARAGSIDTACHQLGAFVNEVEAQTGKAITTEDAAALKEVVGRIRAVLGCGPA